MIYVTPSFTSYGPHNPSFRILEVDSETLLPLEIYTYRLNLTHYNENLNITELEWDLAYKFTEEYNITNLYDYKGIDDLTERLRTDKETQKKFGYNFQRVWEDEANIDTNTLEYYCITNALPSDYFACKGQKDYRDMIFDVMSPWRKKIQN